jgi:hypothetical protein
MRDIDQPIDAVVMWVDGSSEEFQRAEEKALAEEKRKGKAVVHSAARHRDNGELRYLLRSIEHNMPWVRHIYVVTNGQRPSYVNFDVPGISQVSHSEIFPDPESLPCFNSFVIDSYLHNIEGLTDNFLRFSDDFFVGRKIEKAEFLEAGKAFIFKGEVQDDPKNRYQGQVKYNAELMEKVQGLRPKYNIAHAPQLRNRAVCERFEQVYAQAMGETRDNRFRTKKDVMPLMLYPYYALSEVAPNSISTMTPGMEEPMAHVPNNGISQRYAQVAVGSDNDNWSWKLDKVLQVRPVFLNLNDNFGAEREAEGLAVMEEFLETMFPTPSRFERLKPVRQKSRWFKWLQLKGNRN